MNESIDPNLIQAEQPSLQEEMTEPNGNEISDTDGIKKKDSPVQKGKPVLIANGGVIDPPPTKEEICPDVIV
ncbi:hypothetical protein H1Q63_35350 [Desmonostoc muscorum CCALA 125]|nr:hypothetical protein [Desmonostoc muscorum CCALA 125]